MRILKGDELGYHNRFTAGRCVVAVVEGSGRVPGPLPPEIAAALRDSLTVAGPELDGLLGATELAVPELTSALAAALQREIYDLPWRHGALAAEGGDFGIFLEHAETELARICLTGALSVAEALLDGASKPAGERAAALRALLDEQIRKQSDLALHPTTREMIAEAEAREIPWRRIWSGGPHYMLGQGEKLRRLRGFMCDLDSILGAEISHNKLLTSRILADARLPVPQAASAQSADHAVSLAKRIGFPVVVKPNALLKGSGVSVNLTNEEEVRAAFAAAARYDAGVNVERMIPGDDHRILIVAGRFVAAARREPARVTGDGRSSLRELIAEENRNPLRQRNRHFDLLTEIEPDKETDRLLAKAGLTLDSVPAEGQVVQLKATANIASGGTAVDVTDSIHPENVAMALRAAQLVDVDVAGIDYITTDIGHPHKETGGAICEVNTWVSLAPHRAALPKRDVIGPLVDRVFAPGDDGRIPIAVVAGEGSHGDVIDRLAAILGAAGLCCGAATRQDARVAGSVVARGDHASYRGAEILINDPACQAVALELKLLNFATRGLPFDRCNVAALLDVSALDASRSEAARRLAAAARGALIVEAGDEAALEIAQETAGRRTILLAAQGLDAQLRRHIEGGGEAVLAESGSGGAVQLVHRAGKAREVLLPAAQEVSTALLAAAALALALGQPASAISAGLVATAEDARRAVS